MSEIKEVLITAYITRPSLEKLTEELAPAKVTFCMPNDKAGILKAVETADVAILNGDLNDSILAGKNLKWIHCCHAGLDRSAKPELFERGIILTSSSGRSAPALAEHVLMFMLSLTYELPMLLQAKKEHRWAASRDYAMKTGIYGKTVGVIGLGKTGCEVARLCKQFDMKVLGWRRSSIVPENVDEVYSSERGDDLKELISQCDYVVLSIELNDHTYHMIGKEELAVMKETAFLINLGRGKLVDEPELIKVLKEQSIGGAGLDTFETEPLPADNPLWELDNVIITPHITPKLPDREERMLSYVFKNIKAYREGGAFVNRLSEKNIFSRKQELPKW